MERERGLQGLFTYCDSSCVSAVFHDGKSEVKAGRFRFAWGGRSHVLADVGDIALEAGYGRTIDIEIKTQLTNFNFTLALLLPS